MKSEKWDGERELLFSDIISSALIIGEKTQEIIDLIKKIRQEMQQNGVAKRDEKKCLDYTMVFRHFVRHRKLKLLRYLFTLNKEF